MRLVSIATALPERSWTQTECWEALRGAPIARTLKTRSIELLEKVMLGPSGIERRHFCTDALQPILDKSAQTLSETYEREARSLGARALSHALEKANTRELDALFVCTCTGYLCPGLSSHIAEEVNLPATTYLMDVTGAGCGAAILTLRAASNYLSAHPDHRVAVVAVEGCSAAFYVSDDPGVLISLCLFGDGAAALVLDGKDSTGWRFGQFSTLHLPEEREKIRFVNRDGKLCNQLHRAVPDVAADAVKQLYPSNGHKPHVISHAAGRDVLAAIRARLPDQPLAESAEVLRDCGNMSSPSVLFALERALTGNGRTPDNLWLVSFGAGFSCHGCSVVSK